MIRVSMVSGQYLNLIISGLEREKDTKIGGPMVRGISGGQRRRVTLARGMIGFSQVLFCDEV